MTDSAITVMFFDASCSQSTSFCKWNFGDGTADTSVSEPTIVHEFPGSGQYTVKLRATRKDGLTLGVDKYEIEKVVVIP
jgi:PKD repeat protein